MAKREIKEEKITKKKTRKPVAKKRIRKVKAEPERELESPVSFQPQPKKKGNGIANFAVVLIFIAIVLLMVVMWYQSKQMSQPSSPVADNSDLRDEVIGEVNKLKEKLQSLTDQLERQKEEKPAEEQPEESGLSDYENNEIGIFFQYDELLLGEPIVSATDNDEGDAITKIEFSNNPDIWLTAATSDYESDDPLIYVGDEEDLSLLCLDALIVTDDGYCDLATAAGRQTVEKVMVINDEDSINVAKSIYLNLNKGPYQGLSINLDLGAPPVKGRDLFEKAKLIDQLAALPIFLDNIMNRTNLSIVIEQNLEIYQTIIESSRVGR